MNSKNSGTGGYSLLAESDVPLRVVPGTDAQWKAVLGDRYEDVKKLLTDVRDLNWVGLRLRSGDDVSCLNLYQPTKPRVLGASSAFTERGGFDVSLATPSADANPWKLLATSSNLNLYLDDHTAQWVMQKQPGDKITLTDELDQPREALFAAMINGSIFQSELLLSEANFRMFVESMTDMLIVAAPTGRIQAVNDATVRQLGYTADELTAMRVVDLHEPAARPGVKVLGVNPETGAEVTIRDGRFGAYIQLGEQGEEGDEKPKRSSLPRGLKPEDVTLEKALALLSLPREVARHPTSGEPILAGIGRYGPYVQHGKTYANIGRDDDVLEIGANRAIDLIVQKEQGGGRFGGGATARELGTHPEGGVVAIKSGRFGAYVNWNKVNATIPRGTDAESLTLEAALAMIKAKQEGGGGDGGGRNVGDHPEGGALVVKDGRYGPYVAWGKVFATIPKSQSPDSVTLQDAIDLVNARAAATGKKGPVKKAAAKKKPAAKKAAAKPKKIAASDETPFEGGKPAKTAVAKKGAAKKAPAKKATKK